MESNGSMTKISLVLISVLLVAICAPMMDNADTPELSDLPSYFSWRNIEGIDYTTGIKDQSPAPTCEAYGLCAALETLMQYHVGKRYDPDLSETHLYFSAGGTYEAGYVNLIDAADYLIEYGVPDEGCYPDPHRAYDYPFESLPGWQDRTVKIREWGWVPHEEDAIKTALIEHGPLIVCLYFGTDFYFYNDGIYSHERGRIAGGHVVSMVGYDDTERCWIMKNSWGSKWGEEGWFRLSYDTDLFANWYDRYNEDDVETGIMYISGVYGNVEPQVPRVHIETPVVFHNYYRGREFPTLLRKLPLILEAAPRILGGLHVSVSVENTNTVEFYIDGVKMYTDTDAPFTWDLHTKTGFHTLEVRAINNGTISLDIIDFYILMNP